MMYRIKEENALLRQDKKSVSNPGTGSLRTLLCLFLAVCAFFAFSLPDFGPLGLLHRHTRVLTVGFFCGGDGEQDFEGVQNIVLQAIERYREQYPDVEVRFERGIPCEDYSEWLMGKFLDGTEPDVFVARPEDLSVLSVKKMLLSLSEGSAEKETEFYAPLLEACRWNGTLYALPVMCNPQMMAVNRDFLRKYVGNDPGADWSWGEFHQMCRICTGTSSGTQEILRYGVTGYTWEMAAASNAARLFDENGIENYLDETKCVQAVTFHYRLSSLLTDMVGFESGQVAFSPMWASDWRKYCTAPYSVEKGEDFAWYCTTMPGGPGGSNISRTEMLAGAISRRCAGRAEARAFLEILSGDEEVQRSVLDETWSLPASAQILPQLAAGADMENDGASARKDLQNLPPKVQEIDYGLLDDVLKNAAVIRRFSGYEDIFNKLDSEIREAGSSSGNFAVSLRRISNTMEKYTRKQ